MPKYGGFSDRSYGGGHGYGTGYEGNYGGYGYSGGYGGHGGYNKIPSYKHGAIHGAVGTIAAGLLIGGLIAKISHARINVNFDRRHHSWRRKKRSSRWNEERVDFNNIFFEVLSSLDHADCIAKALCYASSHDSPNQDRNGKLLHALGLSDLTMPWMELSEGTAKYQYAAFVGDSLKQPDVDSGCKNAFPKCPLPSESVLNTMTSEMNTCESIVNSFDNLLPLLLTENQQQKASASPHSKNDHK